jgi:hypothetical protein
MGIQAIGQIPHVSNAGMGEEPHFWTSGGRAAYVMLGEIAARMERVRVVHGAWDRCLNSHYGGTNTAVFLDPPYLGYEALYGTERPALEAAAWAREHPELKVALCGHRGDYEMPGWTTLDWERSSNSYAGTGTKAEECIWFSPACLRPKKLQPSLFEETLES